MNISIKKILEFRDLFPNEKNFNLKEVLCKYNRDKIVRIVNCLGINYGNAYMPDPANPFFSDISQKKVEELNPLFNNYLRKHNAQEVMFCTQRTILELMRNTFSIPVEDFKDNGKDEDMEYDLFKVILYINQQLMNFSSSKDIEDISILTFLLNYVLNDVINTDWKQTCQTQIYYVNVLADFLEMDPRGIKLKEFFLADVGISHFSQYIQTLLALITLYIGEQEKNRRGCPVLDLNIIRDESGFIHKSVCDYLSININSEIPYNNEEERRRENNTDYRVFRSHPLIQISDSKYYIYSLPLLCERLYNSLFFDLKKGWENGDYFQFYNKEVIEHILFQKTMLQCIGKKSTYFYPSKEEILSLEPGREIPNQPDFYIREKDALIIFECKGIKINGDLKDKADVDELIQIIKNKLYCSSYNIDPNREKKKKKQLVGITQLVNQMNLIEDDEFTWDSQIPDDVVYYPVIVLEDPKLSQIGVTGILNNWYQPLVKETLAEAECYPIIIMSIDTLFLYSETFEKLGFRTIFDKFLRGNVQKGTSGVDWKFNPLADFNSFIQDNYNISSTKKRFYINLVDKIKNPSQG